MTEAAATFHGKPTPLRARVRTTGPVRWARPDPAGASRAPDAAGNPGRSWLVVLDGVAGADLPAVAEQLAATGADPVPLGGRLGQGVEPADEAEQQARWLTQEAVARGMHRPVLVVGDWLGGLATAAALAARDGGRLLARRAAWATDCLSAGLLHPADAYAVVDLNPAESLLRTAELMPPGDPWRDGVVVEQLRAFWLSPAATLRDHPVLARTLRAVRVRRLDGRLPPAELAAALQRTGPQGCLPEREWPGQGFRPRPAT